MTAGILLWGAPPDATVPHRMSCCGVHRTPDRCQRPPHGRIGSIESVRPLSLPPVVAVRAFRP